MRFTSITFIALACSMLVAAEPIYKHRKEQPGVDGVKRNAEPIYKHRKEQPGVDGVKRDAEPMYKHRKEQFGVDGV